MRVNYTNKDHVSFVVREDDQVAVRFKILISCQRFKIESIRRTSHCYLEVECHSFIDELEWSPTQPTCQKSPSEINNAWEEILMTDKSE